MDACPRCGTRILPGALACISCDYPLTPDPAAQSAPPPPPGPPPYAVPQAYSPYPPAPGTWPQYGGPQPAPSGPGYYGGPPGPAPWTTNGLAITSLIVGILWIFGLGSLLAVIFGHVSRGQIKRRPQRGAGVALAGLIIGYVGLVSSVVFYAFLPKIIHSGLVQNQLVQQDMKDAASAEHDYLDDHGSYTDDGVALRDEGFQPLGSNTILAAYSGSAGYCLVGAHQASTWYLYDSTSDGLSTDTFPSEQAAEAQCTLSSSAHFNTIN